jgi:NADPH-dependent curcumin reductase CurA
VTRSREWQLVRRPQGEPVDADARLVEVDLPDPVDGEVLVRNSYLTVDPYMRGRMNDAPSYVPPFALEAPMDGGAVGVVERVDGTAVDGTGREIRVGDTVLHNLGWRTHAVVPGRQTRVVDAGEGPDQAPAQAYLGVLGMPGHTAYTGLLRIAGLQEGDRVFVSAAAGAVGSLVGQIARLKGASLVVGSAGGPEKVRWLVDEAGFDQAIDYRARPVGRALREAAPDGIDVYFDNVGGDHLEAAIGALRRGGRVAMCGAISEYGASRPAPGPSNLFLTVANDLTLRGFRGSSHVDRTGEMTRAIGAWMRDGRIRCRQTVVDGLEHAPEALARLLRGDTTGKTVVRIAAAA